MDRLESMSVFVAVVEESGFSAAARRLRMPLATVSRKVSELEDHVKVRLFNRTTRRVLPTESGARFYRDCRRILEEIEEAERAAAGEYMSPRGELIVTGPIMFGRLHLVPVIGEFLKAYPEIHVRLHLADRILDLLDEHIDVALRIGALPDSAMMANRVGEVRRVVCASPAYLAERGTPPHPSDLVRHDCVAFAAFEPAAAWPFRVGGKTQAYPINARLTVTTAEAAIDAAIAGAGITRVLSYQVDQAVKMQALAIILEDFEPAAMPVSLVHPSGRRFAQKLHAFLDFAGPRLRTRLAAL